MAAVLMAMNGLSARGLWRCTARATSSLPEPDSPVIKTVALDWLSRPIARNTSCIAGRLAENLGRQADFVWRTIWCMLSPIARRISSSA
jgi:hypothetical protein